MQRINLTIAVPLALIAVALSARAASTPQQLIEALVQSAHQGDLESFLANTTARSQRALADAQAARKKLTAAQKGFLDALDERFGKSHRVEPAPPDRKAVLSRLAKLELLSVQPKGPNEALLKVKTTSTMRRAQVITDVRTFSAIREGGGQWKLDLVEMIKEGTRSVGARTSTYELVTQQIRAGSFKDRISAVVAAANAQRQARRTMGG